MEISSVDNSPSPVEYLTEDISPQTFPRKFLKKKQSFGVRFRTYCASFGTKKYLATFIETLVKFLRILSTNQPYTKK